MTIKTSFPLISSLALAIFASNVDAGPYTAAKNNACPKAWEDSKAVIPVIPTSRETWDASVAADKTAGLAHITNRAQLETIDAVPVTPQNKVDDQLTVASECLVYRNFEVDTADYVAPPSVAPNNSLGWLPAAIY